MLSAQNIIGQVSISATDTERSENSLIQKRPRLAIDQHRSTIAMLDTGMIGKDNSFQFDVYPATILTLYQLPEYLYSL